MTMLLIFIATLFVAYANGANDNFKGGCHAIRQPGRQLPAGDWPSSLSDLRIRKSV